MVMITIIRLLYTPYITAGVGGWSRFHTFASVSPHYSSISCTGRELWLIDCQLTGYNFTQFCYSARVSCRYYYLCMHVCMQALCITP